MGALVLAFALPAGLMAQDDEAEPAPEDGVQLIGVVLDRETGEVVSSAEVVVAAFGPEGTPAWSGTTNSDGRFRTNVLAPGAYQIMIDRLAFTPVSDLLLVTEPGTIDVRVEMVPVDYELDPVVVTVRRRSRLEDAGFYEREASGSGTFITRHDIEARNAFELSDLLRTVPGVRVIPRTITNGGGIRLRRGCEPEIIMDGARMAPPVSFSALPAPEEVEAIEIHHGATAPARFSGFTNCGAVVVWTRDPRGGEAGTVRSLLQVIGGATLVALAVLFAG